jgi:hypothetical protein
LIEETQINGVCEVRMQVELKPELESRLRDVAQRYDLSVDGLVEQVLTDYLDALADAPATWVAATQSQLPRVWQSEDFSEWQPPRDS